MRAELVLPSKYSVHSVWVQYGEWTNSCGTGSTQKAVWMRLLTDYVISIQNKIILINLEICKASPTIWDLEGCTAYVRVEVELRLNTITHIQYKGNLIA